ARRPGSVGGYLLGLPQRRPERAPKGQWQALPVVPPDPPAADAGGRRESAELRELPPRSVELDRLPRRRHQLPALSPAASTEPGERWQGLVRPVPPGDGERRRQRPHRLQPLSPGRGPPPVGEDRRLQHLPR